MLKIKYKLNICGKLWSVEYRMDVKTEDLLKVGLCCKSIWLEIAFNSDP